MLTTEEQIRFEQVTAEMKALGGWKKLSKEQRKEYKTLKDKAEEITVGVLPSAPIPPADLEVISEEASKAITKSNQSYQFDMKNRLMNVWGEMKDADERGKLANMMNDPYLLSLPEDQLFDQVFSVLRDGGDRAVLRRHFNRI